MILVHDGTAELNRRAPPTVVFNRRRVEELPVVRFAGGGTSPARAVAGAAVPFLVRPGRDNGPHPVGGACGPAQPGPPRNRAVGRPGRARRSPARGPGSRDGDMRTDLAGRAPPRAGPGPRPGRVLPGPARRR